MTFSQRCDHMQSSNNMSYESKQKGFTLLELLIVLLIISVSSAVVYISIGIAERKAVLKDNARRVVIHLKYAREISVMQKKVVALKPFVEGNGYALIEIRHDNRDDTEETFKTLKKISLKRSLSIEGDEIIFYPIGYSSGGILIIKDEEGRGYEISVDSETGKIALVKIT